MAALRRDFDGLATVLIAGGLGVLGAIGVALGLAVEPARMLAAYLAAWATALTLAFGGLAVLVIGYAANARWPAVVRRLCETVACGLLPLAALALPLLVTGTLGLRSLVYLACFVIPAELLRRWSRDRDRQPRPELGRERAFSSAMLPVLGLAITAAAFDWLMSLTPHFWSSGFGLYVLTGALRGGLALVIVLAWRGVATRSMPLAPAHFHALGRVLHAFVILWAYIAYFQAMLIQIANKPSEVTFYIARSSDGWRFVTALLVVLAFALPFPLLVPRRLKRRPAYLGALAVMLLVAHYIDLWWLVLPSAIARPIPSWTDLAALCAVGGLTVAACAYRANAVPLLPVGDPYLADGLAYETPT